MRRIPTGIRTVEELAGITDAELQRVDLKASEAYVGNGANVSTGKSYLFVDTDVLKFYNATTKATVTVTVT